MKTQKLALAALLSTQMLLAGLPARADDLRVESVANGSPQETIINMGLDALKSIGGDALKDALFPSSIDYDRIKRDMEEVTKRQIIDAKVTEVLGQIDAAGQNARTDMLHQDSVMALETTRKDLVLNVGKLTKGEFKFPGLGNYVVGAQTEFSILTGMLEKSPKTSNDSCDRSCVLAIAKERLTTHMTYTTDTANEILKGLIDQSTKSIGGCYPDDEIISDFKGRPIVIHHGWMFDDRARGYSSGHFGGPGDCNNLRNTYVNNIKIKEQAIQAPKLNWMYVARANWSKALIMLDPQISQADKNKLVTQAIKDVGPSYFAAAPLCATKLDLAVKGAPNSCQTLKSALDYYKQISTCPASASDIYALVGCN